MMQEADNLGRGEAGFGPRRRGASNGAFTLIEILVVMLLIGILAAILLPVLMKARARAVRVQTAKEVGDLRSVLVLYHEDHSAYPPDTADWSAVGGNTDNQIDDYGIHRYLGLTIFSTSGRRYDAYLGMLQKQLTDMDSDGLGKYSDPYGTPYQIDAMHMLPPDPANNVGWRQQGWPYKPATPVEQRSRDFKIVSYGPNEESADYPFAVATGDTGEVHARDDLRSW